MLTEMLNQYLPMVLQAGLVALFGCMGILLRNLAGRYLGSEAGAALTKAAVSFTEQVYRELHGEQKLLKAMETLSLLLKEKGLTMGKEEMRILLEAAVGEMNREICAKTPHM